MLKLASNIFKFKIRFSYAGLLSKLKLPSNIFKFKIRFSYVGLFYKLKLTELPV